ncbi:MAG TPA: hypothetical protein VF429_07700 [Anaerolineae bacterium]
MNVSGQVSDLPRHFLRRYLRRERVRRVVRILRGGTAHGAALKLPHAKYPPYREMKLETRPVIKRAVRHAVGGKQNG